tara:strand:- start:2 stop:529 length:528 start_codon:yes stop_codon:yes gene_type:complete
MRNFQYLIIFSIFFTFLFNPNVKAEAIVYIDMDKIMQKSKAGKSVIENINKTNDSNIKKFKKIEEEIRSEEKDLIAKKNVLSEEEFSKGLTSLRKKIENYRETRQKAIDEITKKRINASADFAQKIKPILGNYAKEKNIDMVVQKKNIIMGKSELDITEDILKIVDEEISKLKIN